MSEPFAIPRAYRTFAGSDLLQVSMPMGGIGAGSICLTGYGALQNFAVRNMPVTSAEPDTHAPGDAAFGIVRIVGDGATARLLEGPLPVEKIYASGLKAQGYRQGGYEGLPRFEEASFDAAYPFGTVHLSDNHLPLQVDIIGWSPLVPNDDIASGMPCAFLEYRFINGSGTPVDFEFSYHMSHFPGRLAGWAKSRNRSLPATDGVEGRGVSFEVEVDPADEAVGSAALTAVGWRPMVKAMWLRGAWFDSISALWREVSTGTFRENDGALTAPAGDSPNGGSLLVRATLAPGETATYPLVIAWHFPNSALRVGGAASQECSPACECTAPAAAAWRHFYATVWPDAAAVALHAAHGYHRLRARTAAFQLALTSSTIPAAMIDAALSNLAILKSPTLLRQENGNLWGWEGCFSASGCCHGTCTHVWNYAQALPSLFAPLERTLREQELACSMDDRGHVNFRAALPDGPAPHDFHAAADGQLGGILKLYRDYAICGDRAWLRRLYPLAKMSLEYCIGTWDPDRRGALFEPHHNTYDIEFWGPDGMCCSIYVGALSAMATMASTLERTDDAAHYAALAERAGRFMDEQLFNGEYYRQRVQWDGEVRNTSFAESIAGVDEYSAELLQLLKAEGPRYQYGSGCLSDGVIGAWMADTYGVEIPLDRGHIRSSLQAIHRHNFRADLWAHANPQRPGYALGHEAGLLLCSWPRGGKPTLPFVYSDEVWTGIEYQVASHLIREGFVEEAAEIVQAVRSRYDGRARNPFDEYECGSYYARAMASFALLDAMSGFRYTPADGVLCVAPKTTGTDGTFVCLFSTATAYGTIGLDAVGLRVEVAEGALQVKRLRVAYAGRTFDLPADTVVRGGVPFSVALA